MKNSKTTNPILVIDDETSILKVMNKILTRSGYDVDIAADGEEGIRKIENNEYSLIITDIKMAGISGEQIFDYVRNEIKKTTPVVGMSGTPWLLEHIGFDAVLSKPYYMKELLDLIDRLIEQ